MMRCTTKVTRPDGYLLPTISRASIFPQIKHLIHFPKMSMHKNIFHGKKIMGHLSYFQIFKCEHSAYVWNTWLEKNVHQFFGSYSMIRMVLVCQNILRILLLNSGIIQVCSSLMVKDTGIRILTGEDKFRGECLGRS